MPAGCGPRPVMYDKADQQTQIFDELKYALGFLKAAPADGVSQEEHDECVGALASYGVAKVLLFCKALGFESESEWRVARWPGPEATEFRVRSSQLVPYHPLNLDSAGFPLTNGRPCSDGRPRFSEERDATSP